MIYLGTPYSHPNPLIEDIRFELAMSVAATLATHSIPCYVPIAFWHPTSRKHSLPGDHEFWLLQDYAMIERCDEGWFMASEGFHSSKGIRHEIECFEALGKPVYLLQSEADLIAACQRYRPCL